MAKFITLTIPIDPTDRIRLAVDHIGYYHSSDKYGAYVVMVASEPGKAFGVTETPEQIDALIAAAESGQPSIDMLTRLDVSDMLENAMHYRPGTIQDFINQTFDELKARGLAR